MQTFLEEYGKILMVVVVILALILVAVLFRSQIGGIFAGLFNSLFKQATDGTGLTIPTMHP